VLVVEQLRMIDVGALNEGGGAVGDGEQFLDGGLAMAALKAFVTLAQGFRVLHVDALWRSVFLHNVLPFFILALFGSVRLFLPLPGWNRPGTCPTG